MTKADLVKRIADETGLTRKEANDAINSFINQTKIFLEEQTTVEADKREHIEIRGFGSFKLKERVERKGRNPRTLREVEVPARTVPTFKFSRGFKNTIIKVNK